MKSEVQILADLGAEAVQNAIAEYTQWFIVSSLCWLGLGLVCAIAAIMLWKRREKFEDVAYTGAPILLGIALLTAPLNVPTLLNPKAYAIHQLVTDARGR